MDFLVGVLEAVLMIVFIVAAIVILAGLFMIVFGLAAGIDRKIQE